MIEGDNFHSLTCLNYVLQDSFDLIYIDPPYNTGSEDFLYNDNYINSDDTFLHSKWLNFMQKRLTLARNLLKQDGVIFISIDEREAENLKKVCNEVFGEENFIGSFIWRKKDGGGQAKDYFAIEHEYIVVYRKTELLDWIDKIEQRSITQYNKKDDIGNFKITKLAKWGNTARREDRPSMYFPLVAPDGENVYPIAPDGNDGRWRVGKDRMEELKSANLIYWERKADKWVPYEKEYFDNQVKILKKTKHFV